MKSIAIRIYQRSMSLYVVHVIIVVPRKSKPGAPLAETND